MLREYLSVIVMLIWCWEKTRPGLFAPLYGLLLRCGGVIVETPPAKNQYACSLKERANNNVKSELRSSKEHNSENSSKEFSKQAAVVPSKNNGEKNRIFPEGKF